MQGNIDFTGSLSGSIAGGGSGGSDVTITPTLQSGTKIADYTIDSESGSLYAPTPEGLEAELPLIISNNTISIDLSDYVTNSDLNDYQEKLTAGSYINIDSDNEISCTPPITNVWYTPEAGVQQDVLIGKFTVNEVTQNVYAPSGNRINYSLTEQDTGLTWVDGSKIYQRTYYTTNPLQITNSGTNITSYVDNFSTMNLIIEAKGVCDVLLNGVSGSSLWVGYTSSNQLMAYCAEGTTVTYITLLYTKSE